MRKIQYVIIWWFIPHDTLHDGCGAAAAAEAPGTTQLPQRPEFPLRFGLHGTSNARDNLFCAYK